MSAARRVFWSRRKYGRMRFAAWAHRANLRCEECGFARHLHRAGVIGPCAGRWLMGARVYADVNVPAGTSYLLDDVALVSPEAA